MLIGKSKKKLFSLIVSVCIIIIISIFFLFQSKSFKSYIAQEIKIFSCQPFFNDSSGELSISRITNTQKIKKIYSGLINLIKNGCNAEILYVKISLQNLDIIKEDRQNALNSGINIKSRKVPAVLKWKNKKYKASVRLKGDLPNHWSSSKQWSLKFDLKKNKSIEDFKEFSITKPFERRFPSNPLIASHLAKENISTPKFKTMRIDLNGNDWGLMLAEEQFSNAYLELRKLRDSPVIKLTNQEGFRIRSFLSNDVQFSKNKIDQDIISLLSKWRGRLEIDIYNKKDYLKNSNFGGLISLAKSINEVINLDSLPIQKVEQFLNIPMFAKVVATSLVWGDMHSILFDNCRFYLNPYTSKLEPIPTDHLYNHIVYDNSVSNLRKALEFYSMDSEIFYKIYTLNSFQKEYVKALYDIKKSHQNIEGDLNNICKEYGKECQNTINLSILENNLEFLINQKEKIFYKINDYDNANPVPKSINIKSYPDLSSTYKKINFINKDIYSRIFSDGEVILFNPTPFEVKIKQIVIDTCISGVACEPIKIKTNITLAPSNLNFLSKKKITLSENLNLYKKVYLYLELNGVEKKLEFLIENSNYKIDSLIEKKYVIPEYINLKDKTYIVKPGNWLVKSPLVLPYGYNLKILPDTSLTFNEEAYIYLNGGNLTSLGTKQSPIVLKPLNNFWGGIFVSQTKKKISKFNFTKIIGTNFFKHKAINLTGGINFYFADVEINNSEIKNSYAEDSLNIVKSNFIIKSSVFINHKSDALDSDFSNGIIEKVLFKNINGDGLDTSGSEVLISNSNFESVYDKAISVGEKSFVTIKNVEINNSGFGFVSKDGSVIEGNDIIILNSKKADMAAYIKKNFYSGGKINVKNILIDSEKIFIQDDSLALIDNKKIETIKFNSKKKFY